MHHHKEAMQNLCVSLHCELAITDGRINLQEIRNIKSAMFSVTSQHHSECDCQSRLEIQCLKMGHVLEVIRMHRLLIGHQPDRTSTSHTKQKKNGQLRVTMFIMLHK